jgi:NADH-quinone oxidoreductase subunit F
MKVVVGEGSCGLAAGAGKVYGAIKESMTAQDDFALKVTGCIGMCWLEPIVDIYDGEKLLCRWCASKRRTAQKSQAPRAQKTSAA